MLGSSHWNRTIHCLSSHSITTILEAVARFGKLLNKITVAGGYSVALHTLYLNLVAFRGLNVYKII